MIPIIVVSQDEQKIQSYIDDYRKKQGISDSNFFNLYPVSSEFTITQIKELKKEVVYYINQPRLYALHHFHKSSFEAQNAFLKVLEEHNKHIHFFLIVDNPNNLLSTVRSRSRTILLNQKKTDTIDGEIINFLKKLIEHNDLSILNFFHLQTMVGEEKGPLFLFDQIILFFKKRLGSDPHAPSVLKEILDVRSASSQNYVDPQLSIDHILIFIKKEYSS